ncbi:MAG: carboxylating nicotinate-nucleotide diphosphorylase [candidate division FCPU426 bacterium]
MTPKPPAVSEIRRVVRQALQEDVGPGDCTTRAIVRPGDRLQAVVYAQARGVLAGVPMVREVYRQLDRRVRVQAFKTDGSSVKPGDRLLRLQGPAGPILTGERTALNFLGCLSGIATQTATYVRALKGTGTQVWDTRKTVPGLRQFAKYAVRAGGGNNHRHGLYDAVLIKDNHVALAQGIREAIRRTRRTLGKRVPIVVEAENLEQVGEALAGRADVILIDNMSGHTLARAMRMIRGRAKTEVSGGLTLRSAVAAAKLGADRVSVGALTHSAAWLPLHLEVETTPASRGRG